MHTVSDSADVRTAVDTLVRLVRAAGGFVHPDAWVTERDGSISLHAPAGTTGRLLHLPAAVLVPTGGITWGDDGDAPVAIDGTMGLTDLQRRVLDTMCQLYRATRKIVWARAHLPLVTLHVDDPAREGLASLRGERPGEVSPYRERRSAAEGFIASRVLGNGDAAVLMPLVELADHHAAGAAFGRSDGVVLDIAQPAADTVCFARYAVQLDAIAAAAHYGFVDPSIRVARSAPVTVHLDVPGLRSVHVAGRNMAPRQRLDAPEITRSGDGLEFSHLTFDAERPHELTELVGLAVRMQLRSQGGAADPRTVTRALLTAVVDANTAALEAATTAATGTTGITAAPTRKTDDRSTAVGLLTFAYRHQQMVVDEVRSVLM
jgi:hypothetical protein